MVQQGEGGLDVPDVVTGGRGLWFRGKLDVPDVVIRGVDFGPGGKLDVPMWWLRER